MKEKNVKKTTTTAKKEGKTKMKTTWKIPPRVYLLAIGIIVVIAFVCWYFLIPNEGREKKQEEKRLRELEEQLLTYAKEIFPEDSVFTTEENSEYTAYIFLKDMETEFQKDISMFQTDKITCDLYDTYVSFTATSEGVTYLPHLSCGSEKKTEPSTDITPTPSLDVNQEGEENPEEELDPPVDQETTE